MNEIILHHYPASPVSEKVRVALGIKKLAWRSVEIPRLPPKPDVLPLTGGYRRTPFLQIGADIYCDSLCILRELHRRHPKPDFFPGRSEGVTWALARWTDVAFDAAVRLSIGANADQLPEAFLQDRGRLFFGTSWSKEQLKADVPHAAAQVRAQLAWIDQQLGDGRAYLPGGVPGLFDALCYYLVWFVRGRWQGGPAMIAGFPKLEAWETRVKAIGHGKPVPMASAEAIDVARAAQTATPEGSDPGDPQGLHPGQRVSIVFDGDSGEVPVEGKVRRVDAHTIAILRDDPRVGTVCVHFPRVGYRVTRV
ncbi:MAG TPA: glutathione S-transferase N-terminal domain-containing protein [Burkholderiales bacterium]|nr:glutathione S-transferase N-terminal domain-containing protein [Burkholderiales bacterium]